MAAEKRGNDIGPIGERVAENVQRLRKPTSTYELSKRLTTLGRPILASGLTKLEAKKRRVDADDLLALAIALRVSPPRLLLPVDDPAQEVAVTPSVTATQAQLWSWALARSPLLAAADESELDDDPRALLDDFRRRSLPDDERFRDDHTAARAAADVLHRIHLVLEQQAVDESTPRGLRRAIERSETNTPQALRTALRRLNAEIDDLLGDDDGER